MLFAHDPARLPAQDLGQLRSGRGRRQRLGEQDALDLDLGGGMERRRQGDDRAQFRFDLGRIFLRHNAPVEAEDHAIRHHIGVDPARYETDRHLRRAYPGYRRGPRLKADPPVIKSGQDRVRRFERVDAGRGAGGVSRAAEDLDLQVKARRYAR